MDPRTVDVAYIRGLIGDDPVDTSPLADEELDRLEAWLELNAKVELRRSDRHPVQDMGLLYRAVHELLQLRRGSS